MSTYHQGLLILIISFTCVAVFVITAIAVALDMFNLFKMRADIRRKLHGVLVVEVVATSVAAFGALLNTQPLADKVETATAHIDAGAGGRRALPLSLIDTASAPKQTVSAAPYLSEFGISVEQTSPDGSDLVIVNNRALYEGRAVKPTMSQNILTQANTDGGLASFTLRFPETVDSVRFVRPALFAATASGVTHPAWRAEAYDVQGHKLSSHSEGLIRSYSNVPARVYTLIAPGFEGISTVHFESDPRLNGKPFAGFAALLIEDLSVSSRPKSGA